MEGMREAGIEERKLETRRGGELEHAMATQNRLRKIYGLCFTNKTSGV